MKKLMAAIALMTALACAATACKAPQAPAVNEPAAFAVVREEGGPERYAAAESAAPAFDASRSITVVAREDGSGTKSAFMELIGLKGKPDPENVIIQTGTAGILAEVKGNPAAIAYESLGYVTADVKMLKVDGAEASVENIKTGAYKLARPLSVVFREQTLDNAVNRAFLNFLHSGDAQAIIAGEGYVPVVDNAEAYAADDALTGTIHISGSTSLKPLMDELVKRFMDLQPGVTVNVGGGGSGQGYSDAQEGVSEFGMISEEFRAEKAPACVSYMVCKDGVAVIVHRDNPLESITPEQLKRLYDAEAGADAIVLWAELLG